MSVKHLILYLRKFESFMWHFFKNLQARTKAEMKLTGIRSGVLKTEVNEKKEVII